MWVQDITGLKIFNFVMPKINYCCEKCSLNLFLNICFLLQFQEEKYGDNYNEDAELAKIASKHKNPNDDLEDIFTDEISKNRNEAKDSEREKQKAINAHIKIERSLEGCEHCVDSKNMLKHLMVSCGSKVYMAVPARKSLVKGQCIITTIQHSTCVTSLDEDVWDEIMV